MVKNEYSCRVKKGLMAWPFKDYDYIGDRYVTVKDSTAFCGEIMFYERNISAETPTECVICIEAESEMYTKYAHPKAHAEAHSQANTLAEQTALKEKDTEEYIEYYTFFYGKHYRRIYKELYVKYKEEYSGIVLGRCYNEKICEYHQESIQYHYTLQKKE